MSGNGEMRLFSYRTSWPSFTAIWRAGTFLSLTGGSTEPLSSTRTRSWFARSSTLTTSGWPRKVRASWVCILSLSSLEASTSSFADRSTWAAPETTGTDSRVSFIPDGKALTTAPLRYGAGPLSKALVMALTVFFLLNHLTSGTA
ncbi:hypothetical protein D9M72_477500 [compost metagenome]